MTRARWLQSAASLFALWLAGALFLLPRLQRDLEAAARGVLSREPGLAKRLGGLRLSFDGLQARLGGSVRTAQDRSRIEAAVRDLVRAPTPLSGGLGRQLNPVGGVRSEIALVPSPPGWLLLAANGQHARLLGTAASTYEARDLARSVQDQWSTLGGVAEGMPGTDPGSHDEAPAVFATLHTIPPPQNGAQASLARIGQAWLDLNLGQPDSELRSQARALGVGDAEWRDQVLPALQELRAAFRRQKLAQAEQERLSRLPPGYLFIAVRGQEAVLSGEVGTEAVKDSLLADALAALSPCRLHDEIRVNAQRRPSADFGPITTALLPDKAGAAGGASCHLSLCGEGWKPVDWQTAAAEQSWKSTLPPAVDARPLQQDSARLCGWLQGEAPDAPPPPERIEPALITLVLFGSRAFLSGQVAEEAVRAQLVAAVRQAYGARFLVISDDLRARGGCEPSGGILNTLKSLPAAPAADRVGFFAVARPGGGWTVIPATRDLAEAGGLARSGALPAGIPAATAEELSAEAVEELRLHLAHTAIR